MELASIGRALMQDITWPKDDSDSTAENHSDTDSGRLHRFERIGKNVPLVLTMDQLEITLVHMSIVRHRGLADLTVVTLIKKVETLR